MSEASGESAPLENDPALVLRLALKQAIWDRLEQPIEPGMGGPPEPIWEVYRPEGVAVLLANHLAPLFELAAVIYPSAGDWHLGWLRGDDTPDGDDVPLYRLLPAPHSDSQGGSDV